MHAISLMLLLALTAPAREFCNKCQNTGAVENKAHERIRKEVEAFGLDREPVLHVSFHVEGDSKGAGLEALPCSGCRAPEATQAARDELERRAREKREWLEQRRAIDEAAKPRKPLAHVETEHFRLVCGLRKVTLADKRVLDTEQAALLYAKRLEDFYDWFQQLLGYTDEQARVLKHDVYLMGDLRTLMSVAHKYCNLPTDRAARAVGDPSILTTWPETGVYARDADFHRHVLYHVSHLLLGVYHMKVWLVENAGWLEEGLAHLCEMDLFTLAGNSSNLEQSEGDRDDADWEPVVRQIVAERRTLPFAELMRKRADMLTPLEHQLAWSYVDFLHTRGGDRLAALIRDLKEDQEMEQVRESLRVHYDLTVTGLDEAWAAWVLENYRTKPRQL